MKVSMDEKATKGGGQGGGDETTTQRGGERQTPADGGHARQRAPRSHPRTTGAVPRPGLAATTVESIAQAAASTATVPTPARRASCTTCRAGAASAPSRRATLRCPPRCRRSSHGDRGLGRTRRRSLTPSVATAPAACRATANPARTRLPYTDQPAPGWPTTPGTSPHRGHFVQTSPRPWRRRPVAVEPLLRAPRTTAEMDTRKTRRVRRRHRHGHTPLTDQHHRWS